MNDDVVSLPGPSLLFMHPSFWHTYEVDNVHLIGPMILLLQYVLLKPME